MNLTRVESKNTTSEYLATGFVGLALACAVGALFTLSAVLSGGLFGMALPDTLSVIWAGVGFAAGILALFVIRYILREISAQREHEREMDIRLHAPKVIVREIAPPLPEPDPEPPMVTRGVKLVGDENGDFIAWDDVEWFAKWIAAGGSWSENTWKGKQLPFGYNIGSTDTYDRLIQLFIKPGIITGRDGEKRKTGTLAVKDLGEMLKLLEHKVPPKAN